MYVLTKQTAKGRIITFWIAMPNVVVKAPPHGSTQSQTYTVKRVKKRTSGQNEALLEEVSFFVFFILVVFVFFGGEGGSGVGLPSFLFLCTTLFHV